MIPISIPSLLSFLKQQKFDASLQKETGQLVSILNIDRKDFPFFLRIMEKSDLLQLLVFMPLRIKPETHADLARLMHLINKDLDIPGFGMDESSDTCFYRLTLPYLDHQIDERILDAYLKSLRLVCESIAPSVIGVASGLVSYQDILKRVSGTGQ